VIKVTKYERILSVGHIECRGIWDMCRPIDFQSENLKCPLGRPRHRWGDNTEICLEYAWCARADWIPVGHYMDQHLALLHSNETCSCIKVVEVS
jgi:hypothetical protein